ncbi:MAG: GreA/GreB family elongation factor [Minisyncoccia bacterium]
MQNKDDTIKLGDIVTINLSSRGKISIQLVQTPSDPSKNLISIDTPLGQNLIGKKIGDSIEYKVNDKIFKVDILNIQTK